MITIHKQGQPPCVVVGRRNCFLPLRPRRSALYVKLILVPFPVVGFLDQIPMSTICPLPPEIRRMIFASCLHWPIFQRRINLNAYSDDTKQYRHFKSFLLVCQQISAEVLEIVYGRARFQAACDAWNTFCLAKADGGLVPFKLSEHVGSSGKRTEWSWTSLACLDRIRHFVLYVDLHLFQYENRRQICYISGLVGALKCLTTLENLRIVFYLPEVEKVCLKRRPRRWGWECQVTGNRFEDTQIPYDPSTILYNMTRPIMAVLNALPNTCNVTWVADDTDDDGRIFLLRDMRPQGIADDLVKGGKDKKIHRNKITWTPYWGATKSTKPI